jgi:uncharacterized protein YecE (DUF72 family)
MRFRVGTSGYSYKEWKGSFYPEKLPAAQMLRFYAERFGTVEVNNTFYRMPTPALLSRWLEEVPDEFAFVLKASRRITHDRQLRDVAEPVSRFFAVAAVLEAKLGPVLFQLPPHLKKDVPRLRDFLALVPPGRRAALEFRHASWWDDEVYETLRSHGAALCIAETDDREDPPPVATAPWGYLRLRREDYSDRELEGWIERLREQPWSEAFVFFKHEDAGAGPRLAAELGEVFTRVAERRPARPAPRPRQRETG